MTEEAPKKGMSKGCMIALIVVGALVVIAIALVIVCNIYQDELIISTTSSAVVTMKAQIAEKAPEGIDTAYFNAVADKFMEKFTTDTLDLVKFSQSFTGIQNFIGEQQFTTEQIESMLSMMKTHYPELNDITPSSSMFDSGIIDSTIMKDSTVVR